VHAMVLYPKYFRLSRNCGTFFDCRGIYCPVEFFGKGSVLCGNGLILTLIWMT